MGAWGVNISKPIDRWLFTVLCEKDHLSTNTRRNDYSDFIKNINKLLFGPFSINMIKMQTEQNIPSVHSPIINLPPELFAKFCAFLSPTDLLVLSQVCRTFFGYLCAPNSISTQQIWKKS